MFALNERRDRSNLLLSKMEAAIEAYSNWVEILSSWPKDHFDLFYEGRREEVEKSLTEILDKASVERRKAKMLQQIYLPDQNDVILSVLRAHKEFIIPSRDIRLAAIKGDPLPDWASEKISDAGISIVKAGQEGAQRLYDAARQHAQAPFLVRLPSVILKVRFRFRKKPA
jgi:hypothetical protein